MTLADRIAVMDRGMVHQVAPPAELYAHPTNPFVAGFEAVVPSARSFAAGTRVGAVVRPETVHLGREGPYRGIVRRAVYLGSQVEYEVDLNGLRLEAVGRSPLEEGIFAESDSVGVTIGFEVAHLLEIEGGSP